MTASPTSKTALDGQSPPSPFPSGMAIESVSGNFVSTVYIKEPVGEAIVTVAQDGTDGTGITPPAGGVGIRGWESGIYKLLSNPLIANMNGAQVTVTPAVTVGTYTPPIVFGGIMNFASILNPITSIATLQSITLRFKATVQGAVTFYVAIFSASPAGTFNDHATPAIAAADSAILLGVYAMSSTSSLSVLGSSETIYNLDNIGKKMVGTSGTLFAVVTCKTGSPVSPVTTSEMSLTLACDW